MSDSDATAPPVTAEITDEAAVVSSSGAPLWSYVYGARRRPFVHPLRTPSGVVLTVDQPDDHPWHHALWFTIKFVNGENFWEEFDDYGVLRHDGPPAASSDGRQVTIDGELHWIRPDRETVVLDEHRRLVHVPLEAGAYAVDFATELVPRVDGKKMLEALEPVMSTVGTEPEDARIEVVDGKPRIIPAKVGVELDPADIESRFADVAVQRGAQRRLAVEGKVTKPSFTTAEARAMKVKRRVSTWTTYFPYAEYRNVNLTRAAELIDGTLLKPGETFSLNKVVGERTAANGFTEGYIISDGIFKKDFGGGVSLRKLSSSAMRLRNQSRRCRDQLSSSNGRLGSGAAPRPRAESIRTERTAGVSQLQLR